MTERGTCSDAELISGFEGYELLPHAVRLLAQGSPVTVGELAVSAGWAEEKVETVLRSVHGTDWDQGGHLEGFGLTLRPTRHHFIVEGRSLYTWCAADTLIFTVLLGKPAVAISPCPATGQVVRVELAADHLGSVDPPEAVVTESRCNQVGSDFRAQICDHGHFFVSPEAASGWLSEHPDGEVHSVRDAFERCRATCQQVGWLTTEAGRP
jgi:alkylmercury lyase